MKDRQQRHSDRRQETRRPPTDDRRPPKGRSQPFGQSGIRPLERCFNSRPIAARGDNFTVNAGSFDFTQPFAMDSGTAQRLLVDLAAPSAALAIHTTGQSGHLFHPHRADLIAPWQRVDYHRLRFARADAEASAKAALRLVPHEGASS